MFLFAFSSSSSSSSFSIVRLKNMPNQILLNKREKRCFAVPDEPAIRYLLLFVENHFVLYANASNGASWNGYIGLLNCLVWLELGIPSSQHRNVWTTFRRFVAAAHNYKTFLEYFSRGKQWIFEIIWEN